MTGPWAFSLIYNEAALIQYWVRHYGSFCERLILFVDADTNDGTEELAREAGAEVRLWSSNGLGLDDKAFIAFANRAWPEAKGQTDWVIWVDADEFLYDPNMPARLADLKARGVNLPETDYYVMSSDSPPHHAGQIYDDPRFRRGLFVERNAKLALFNPNELTVSWEAGKHNAYVVGEVQRDDNEPNPIKNLHYRWLGEDYLRARDNRNFSRLSENAKASGFGIHVYPTFVGPYNPAWPGPGPSDVEDILS